MKKVLVAEDDQFLLKAYKVKFEKAGFEVKLAENGEEALKILRDFKPDIMLLDLIMPLKDGFSTLEEMQKDDALKKIPVIIASNLGQKEDIEKGKKLGAKDYIVKSNTAIEDIVKKVQAM